MKILMFMVCILSTTLAYSQDSPKSVVQFALQSLTNGDIEKLLEVTENSELRQVKELIAMMDSSARKKDSILQQYQNLKSWSIDSEEKHDINGRKIAIVSTEWKVNIPLEASAGKVEQKANQQKIFVDYMLEKFDGQWKIISRKSKS